ncbi:1-phosphofructokinase family hexose kinase [Microbacterium invictum]|uniref:1-phosphofructokinase n=1 Tax=Microbacterium invictum TaxID=515415 RepID=A0AA40SNM9_9MICO|nr:MULTISPECIES: PfkB family carbohydrate kinase [Microbacterium]MBB4139556.1 1-phosphofructokinase [Microbacterium invictum]
MSDVVVFAPSPVLTVTVEEHSAGPDIHVHAGGQGVWQARMLMRLGASVTMCSVITGETGGVVRHLLEEDGVTVAGPTREGRGAAYIHDRRSGAREVVVEADGDALGRHELDELFSATLREGAESGLVILSGPQGDGALDADTYRRLANDLKQAGARVVVDLAGDRLNAALAGGVTVLKVSDEELHDDGLLDDPSHPALLRAMRTLRSRGADTVIVTRASEPLLLLDGEGFLEITPPRLEVADTRGAGDSLTAGIAAGLARGESPREAVTMAAAAGALNVTRHGLGTGDPEAIAQLRKEVTTRVIDDQSESDMPQPDTGRVSPDGLAALAQPDDEEAER